MIKKINRIHYEGTNGSFLTINQFGASFGTIEQIKRATRINLYNKDFAKFESNDYKEMMLSFAGGFDKLKFLVDGYDTKRIYQILNGNLIESKELRLNDWDYSIWSYCANENSIICSSRVEGIRRYSLVDLGSKTIKESVSCSINLIDDFLFHYSNLSILCFDPTTMIEVWSKDYTIDLDHIEGMNRVMAPIIGVHSDVFVFSYQGDWLVGVDVHTGNVLWKVNEGWVRAQILENGHIFVMGGSRMLLRDIKTGELISSNDESQQEILSDRMNYTFIGDHVILTGRPSDTIGAYNTKTYKYDWIYKEEGTQWSPKPMKYYHPYLFVNDSKGNLHVFKVEDEMNLKKEV